ncbi:MAG: hypothetical protein RI558_06815 [Psychroflexus sp.]|nr:hypothetical protein [Psychroflexus sp.]MDR9448764.1 hypothetical protein [Psychroflexus sp.]
MTTENNTAFCTPNYVIGLDNLNNYGGMFYHFELEFVYWNDGKWTYN